MSAVDPLGVRYFTVRQVAAQLQVSKMTVYRVIADGDLHAIRVRRDGRAIITGYACACPQPDAPTRPAVVLDPFGGTGTTALVASAHGRVGITVDRSADYCRLAAWRCSDPGERARARDLPKPPPIPEGMEPLFTM